MTERRAARPRTEDLLLAAWLVLVEPILLSPDASTGGTSSDPLRAALGILGLAGLAVAIGARPAPGVTTALTAERPSPWVVGPLVGAAALALEDTSRALGPADAGAILAMLIVGVAIAARSLIPPLPATTRRALVTPFVLVTSGYFTTLVTPLRDLFDLGQLGPALAAEGTGLGLLLLGGALLGVAAFYTMLVYAPRQVAEREGGLGAWSLRFVVFLVALVVGETLAGVVRP